MVLGVERIVSHLKGQNIPIAIASSSSEQGFQIKSKRHKDFFSNFHHKVMGGSDPNVKRGKPFPDVYLRAAELFPDRPKPEKCLVFEDAPNGVAAALAAGMQTVLVPGAEVPPEQWKQATLMYHQIDHTKLDLFGLPPMKSWLTGCK